ncbi:hypothetical protein Plhal304r1_c079g0165521 [Plasmopara halstedii]
MGTISDALLSRRHRSEYPHAVQNSITALKNLTTEDSYDVAPFSTELFKPKGPNVTISSKIQKASDFIGNVESISIFFLYRPVSGPM